MTHAELLHLEQLAGQASPGPWRDLTDDWNAALLRYRERYGAHYDGPLRGANKRCSKEAYVLIVEDNYHGDPIVADRLPVAPDYYELHKVLALTVEDVFLARRDFGITARALFPTAEGRADRLFIAAAREAVPALVAEVRRLRAELAILKQQHPRVRPPLQ
jgi:hypothetical protein